MTSFSVLLAGFAFGAVFLQQNASCDHNPKDIERMNAEFAEQTAALDSLYSGYLENGRQPGDLEIVIQEAAGLWDLYKSGRNSEDCSHHPDIEIMEKAMQLSRRARAIAQAVHFSDELDRINGNDGSCHCGKCEKMMDK